MTNIEANSLWKQPISRRNLLRVGALLVGGLVTEGLFNKSLGERLTVSAQEPAFNLTKEELALPDILGIPEVKEEITQLVRITLGQQEGTVRQNWLKGTIENHGEVSWTDDFFINKSLIEKAIRAKEDVWVNICPEVTIPAIAHLIRQVEVEWKKHTPALLEKLGLEKEAFGPERDKTVYINLPENFGANTTCLPADCERTTQIVFNLGEIFDPKSEIGKEMINNPEELIGRVETLKEALLPDVFRLWLRAWHESVHIQQLRGKKETSEFLIYHRNFMETITEMATELSLTRPEILAGLPVEKRPYAPKAAWEMLHYLNQKLPFDERSGLPGGTALILRAAFSPEKDGLMVTLYKTVEDLGFDPKKLEERPFNLDNGEGEILPTASPVIIDTLVAKGIEVWPDFTVETHKGILGKASFLEASPEFIPIGSELIKKQDQSYWEIVQESLEKQANGELQMILLGYSFEGRPIFATLDGKEPLKEEDKCVVVVSGVHPRERSARVTSEYIVENLRNLKNKGELPKELRIVHLIMVNPDGHEYELKHPGLGRKNMNFRGLDELSCDLNIIKNNDFWEETRPGVDLNRNFSPYDDGPEERKNICSPNFDGRGKFEPETLAVMNFLRKIKDNTILLLDYHGKSEKIVIANDPDLVAPAKRYAEILGYPEEQVIMTRNSGDSYQSHLIDWFWLENPKVLSILVEVGPPNKTTDKEDVVWKYRIRNPEILRNEVIRHVKAAEKFIREMISLASVTF